MRDRRIAATNKRIYTNLRLLGVRSLCCTNFIFDSLCNSMKTINNYMFAMVIAGMFCVLASYSWGRYVTPYPRALETKHVQAVSKPVQLWKTKKAQQLAEVYNLTPNDVIKPIKLWGKK